MGREVRIDGVRRRFRLPGAAGRVDREVEAEIAFHLESRIEALVAAGVAPDEARRRAVLEFGDVDESRRELTDVDRRRARRERYADWWGSAAQDVRFATRALRRAPGFALVVLLTLALGIGGTTAVFSVVRATLLAPLPFDEPGRLVRVYQLDPREPGERQYLAGPYFMHLREHGRGFAEVASLYSYGERGADVTVGDRPERVRLLRISADYFGVLGVAPSVGRPFTREEERGERLAIVSRALADRLGHVTPGGTLTLDGEPYTVVGIGPPAMADPIVGRVDVWVPETLHTESARHPDNHHLTVLARLAPGVTVAQARAELARLDRELAERFPENAATSRLHLVPLHEDLVAAARSMLLVLLGGVVLVLLIANVNVANLLMVRSLSRAPEMAVRAAVGAGRGRLVRQLLTESVLLALAGGAAGVLLAVVGARALVALGRDALPPNTTVAIDRPVLLFALGLALLTGLTFGLAPALRLSRTRAAAALRLASTRSTVGRRHVWARGTLVAGQVALALVLLVGASALAASMYRLSRTPLGVHADEVLTFELNLPAGRYDAAARARFHRAMTATLSALPGVRAVGATSRLPATGSYHGWGARALTGASAGAEVWTPSEQRVVEGDYFDALQIPLLDGRTFDARDGAGTRPVAVVSERFARALFPGGSALGQRIRAGSAEREIIGVVGDVALDPEGTPAAHVYHLHAQFAENRNWPLTYVVAAEGEAGSLLPAVRGAIRAVDPRLVLHNVAMLDEVLGRGTSQRRFAFVLTSTFAALAMALATMGLYGVLAFVVRQRRREIGIRLALGATQRRVAGAVLGQGLAVTAAGIAAGLLGALAAAQVLESLVFDVAPTDPRLLLAAAAMLALVAVIAALVPAVRASRTPPGEVLREA
jgi:putative ABC transport system permease protein